MVSLEEGNLIATISTCTMKKWPWLQSGVVSLEEGNLIATISTCTMKKWPSKRGGLSWGGQFNSHYIYMYNEKVVSLEESNLIVTISTCTMKKRPSKWGGLSWGGQFNSHYIYMYMKKWPSKWGGLSGDKVGNLVVFYCLTVHLKSGLSWVTFDGRDLNWVGGLLV